MARVLCIVLCLVAIVCSVCVIGYCCGIDDGDLDIVVERVEETHAIEIPPEVVTQPSETKKIIPEPTTVETTEPEPTEETSPPYSQEELEMLALVIYQEAGSDACEDTTRLMVGTVVMNRVADPRFPNTIYDVLTQKYQYGRLHWTGIVWPERAGYESEKHAVERAYQLAERILLGERALPEDVIWQAEFVQGSEVVAYQDGTYFCR